MADTLYSRLGGYDGISAACDNLLPRLQGWSPLGRFWARRGEDSVRREKQPLINFLCSQAGGPMSYVGRDMKTSHKGMRIDDKDWTVFIGHLTSSSIPSRFASASAPTCWLSFRA